MLVARHDIDMPKLLRSSRPIRELETEAADLLKSRGDAGHTLDDARDELAQSYGFHSWRQLEVFVEHSGQEGRDFLFLACLNYWPTDRESMRSRARSMLTADPSLADKDIYHAAAVGNVTAVERFLDADPALANARGGFFDWEAMLYACYSRLNLPDFSTFECAKLLLQRGADANAYFMWGGQYRFTALTGAFGEGEMGPSNQPEHERCVDLARMLLESGADPNDGQALYNRMFEPGQFWIEMLLDFGLGKSSKVNWLEEDRDRLVPSDESILDYQLRWAVEHDHIDRARLLIGAGADVSAKNKFGDSYYTIALKAGQKDFAAELASLGSERQELPEIEEFIALCMGGDLQGTRDMLEKSPNLVKQAEEDFADSVGHAAGQGRLKALTTFQALGFDLGKKQGQSPMHRAVLGGQLEVLRWLVEQGGDTSLRDDMHGTTPLVWSYALGREECREYLSGLELDLFDSIMCENTNRIESLVNTDPALLETPLKNVRGSQYNYDDDWMTPIAFAATRGKVDSTRCLLALSANPQVANSRGVSLKDLLRDLDLKETLDLL